MKKTGLFFLILIVLSSFILAACGGPAAPAAQTPLPYTGEAAQKDAGLKIYQVQPDGTRIEVKNVNITQETQQSGPVVLTDTKGMVIDATGFQPDSLTFKAGTKLIIQNIDTVSHQPSSDPHPAHTDCPELNAGKPLAAGESYEVTITGPKVCGIHDHLNPDLKATITVTE